MNQHQELDLCKAIETGLCNEYRRQAALTDALCIIGLDNAVIALKQHAGFAKNETVLSHPGIDGVVAQVRTIGLDQIAQGDNLTLKDIIAAINKIKKSVARHTAYGPRAYFTFVQDYV